MNSYQIKSQCKKISFMDFWLGFDSGHNFFTTALRSVCDFSLSGEADYVFYSCFGGKHLHHRNTVRIFFSGEDQVPDFNICDYALGCHHLKFQDRYFRLPLYLLYEEDVERVVSRFSKHAGSAITNRPNFCDYIYSNSQAASERDAFFFELKKFKPVISAGRHLNNTGILLADKYELQKKSRFSIVFENACSSGYTSEKILQAFAAGSIPIYWGNPDIEIDFNPEAFVNCHRFDSFEDVITYVKQIEESPILYKKIIQQDPFMDREKPASMKERLKQFLQNIFEQPKEKSFRRSRVFFNSEYEKRIYEQLRSVKR